MAIETNVPPRSATETPEEPTKALAVADVSEMVRELLVDRPLYAKIEGDEALIQLAVKAMAGSPHIEFDLYCVDCGQVTPWKVAPFTPRHSGGGAGNRYPLQDWLPPITVVHAVCLRKQHFYSYVLHVSKSAVQKIGQKPSFAELAHGELKATPGIKPQDRKELGRAFGLFAHDTPLGAFVYLRRVFERIIDRARDTYRELHGEDVDGWLELRMGERVKALGNVLPPEISANASVFGLLSKGIHELSDEDAATLFPLIKAVILQMLGDEERHRQSVIARGKTGAALQTAIGRFSGPAQAATAE